jgi:hypothetical protein
MKQKHQTVTEVSQKEHRDMWEEEAPEVSGIGLWASLLSISKSEVTIEVTPNNPATSPDSPWSDWWKSTVSTFGERTSMGLSTGEYTSSQPAFSLVVTFVWSAESPSVHQSQIKKTANRKITQQLQHTGVDSWVT